MLLPRRWNPIEGKPCRDRPASPCPEIVNNLRLKREEFVFPQTMSRYDNAIGVARLSWCPQILDFIKEWGLARSAMGARRLPLFVRLCKLMEGRSMKKVLRGLFQDEQGQDIAEYAVMLAVILVIVVGTVRLIGSNANTVFSQVASTIQ